MKNNKNLMAWGLALFLFLAFAHPVHAQSAAENRNPPAAFDVEKAIAAGDHQALAEYYRSQAEAQREIAKRHGQMRTDYRKTHVHYKGIENTLSGHCGTLRYQALKAAEQYDAMAKIEEKLAKEKK